MVLNREKEGLMGVCGKKGEMAANASIQPYCLPHTAELIYLFVVSSTLLSLLDMPVARDSASLLGMENERQSLVSI